MRGHEHRLVSFKKNTTITVDIKLSELRQKCRTKLPLPAFSVNQPVRAACNLFPALPQCKHGVGSEVGVAEKNYTL